MTDPDRYDLDLLEPLGAVAPPTPEVLNRVADNLHARYLQDATSSGRPATFTRQRTRLALPVAATATAAAAVLAVGLSGATHSGHRNGPAVPAAMSPTAASLPRRHPDRILKHRVEHLLHPVGVDDRGPKDEGRRRLDLAVRGVDRSVPDQAGSGHRRWPDRSGRRDDLRPAGP